MRKFWDKHSLTIILSGMLVATLVIGTWATWTEFRTNETAGLEEGAPFWSQRFLAYWVMQITMNYAPELMGLIAMVLLTKRWREYGSKEG